MFASAEYGRTNALSFSILTTSAKTDFLSVRIFTSEPSAKNCDKPLTRKPLEVASVTHPSGSARAWVASRC